MEKLESRLNLEHVYYQGWFVHKGCSPYGWATPTTVYAGFTRTCCEKDKSAQHPQRLLYNTNFNTHIYLGPVSGLFFSHLLSLSSQAVWSMWLIVTVGQHIFSTYPANQHSTIACLCPIDMWQDWSTVMLLHSESAVNRPAGWRIVIQIQVAVTSQEVTEFWKDLVI